MIVAIQFTLGLAIFTTALRHHLLGHLQPSGAFAALAPVLLLHGFSIGAMWLTFGLLAPLLVLTHGYVVYVLLRRMDELSPSAAGPRVTQQA